MEIPKMKILIYILTFAGYAWTGFGADIISNLREAVISAEKIFGDFFQNAITVVRQFRNVKDVLDAAIEEDCEYTCANGVAPVPNKYHKSSSNGCGSYGFEINQHLNSGDITACCNEHDICYDTCNSGKYKCDFDLQRCLFKLCEAKLKPDSVIKGCKATAKVFFSSTFALGCKAYQDSQKSACYCQPTKKSKFSAGGEL